MKKLSHCKIAAGFLKADYDRALSQVEEEEAALLDAADAERDVAEAREILQHVSQEVQQQAHDKIAGVVSRCLSSVFQDPYEFRIEFERKRGKTEAVLSFWRGGERFHPTLGAGGGVVDVAAFALRLACMMLTKPPLRRVLVADEPFRNVHGEGNRRRVRELIETLPGELGVQIIMVTGLSWLECGKVIGLGG